MEPCNNKRRGGVSGVCGHDRGDGGRGGRDNRGGGYQQQQGGLYSGGRQGQYNGRGYNQQDQRQYQSGGGGGRGGRRGGAQKGSNSNPPPPQPWGNRPVQKGHGGQGGTYKLQSEVAKAMGPNDGRGAWGGPASGSERIWVSTVAGEGSGFVQAPRVPESLVMVMVMVMVKVMLMLMLMLCLTINSINFILILKILSVLSDERFSAWRWYLNLICYIFNI